VRGRVWLIAGAVIGVAIAAGHLPFIAGAARSLAETTERLVGSGANRIIRGAASAGAPKRVVQGFGGLIAILIPGVTALLLIVAARGSLRLRSIIALLVVALGAATYAYQPGGKATGVFLLALVIGGLAVALTGPLVALPLALLAGLIAGEFLPRLVQSSAKVTQASVNSVHQSIYDRPGTPAALQIIVLVVAAVPFLFAARLVLRR
jgi:hypothetical protein